MGVGFRAVSKWENGITLPDISIIPKLSKILGINVDYLLSPPDYYSNLHKKNIKEKIKFSIYPENKIHNYKKENYKVLREVGIALVVEVIVLNIVNELSLKSSLIISSLGFICIIISNNYNKQ